MIDAVADALSGASVLVAGDSMLDQFWFGDVERISPEAPVPIVRVTSEEFRLGGGANVALNIATLGARASLLGVVGDDPASERMRAMLAERQIRAVLQTDPRVKTIVKLRVSGRSQQLLRIDFEDRPGAQVLAHLQTAFEQALDSHRCVIFSDYGKGALADIPQMVARARAERKPVLVDPKGTDFARYRGATMLTPNRSELAQVIGRWSGEADLEERAQRLREELSLDALLVTRSEEGMSLFDAAGAMHVGTDARQVYDVTGAGDTVIATLGAMIAAGATLREAVPIANRAGGIVVGKFGTSTVTQAELFG